MPYKAIAQLSEDRTLLNRVAACAFTQGVPNHLGWAFEHAWQLAVTEGWAERYAAALAAENEEPGGDDQVISDAMICASVTALVAADAAAPPAPDEPAGVD